MWSEVHYRSLLNYQSLILSRFEICFHTFTHAAISRRVSVIRGKVLTPSGQGLRGVRVSNGLSLKEGFTLTRSDGWFDMLVNGGGVVTLKFGKSPFPYQSRNVYVPWNQVDTR